MRTITRAEVDEFEKLVAQLTAVHQELVGLTKKSANDAVNEFKLKLINAVLARGNAFFGSAYVPFEDFTVFAADTLPSNSDVSFVVAQYLECAEKFRADHIRSVLGAGWIWNIDKTDKEADENIRTAPPKKIQT